MKKLIFSLLFLAVGFGLGLGYKKVKKEVKNRKREESYRIAHAFFPVLEQKPFVILTMSYNNGKICEKNLFSLLEQDYENYRILYIDDSSTDGTYEKVEAFLKKNDPKGRVTLLRNEKNEGAMANLYHTVHLLKNEEIVAVVDGDDFLAHRGVLAKLNAYYANPDVWITYGNYVEYPTYRRTLGDFSTPIDWELVGRKGIRKHPFTASHLRTFYAGLFKRIKLEDFLYLGNFYPTCCDVASMLPMLELAGKEHAYFVPDVLYLYNTTNPISDFRKDLKQITTVDTYLRARSSYSLLGEHPKHDFIHREDYADIVVFSYNCPMQLYAFLESAEKYITHLHQTFVIYRVNSESYEKGYQEVKNAFPQVTFIRQSEENTYQDFAPLLQKILFHPEVSPARFVAFAVDNIIVKDAIDMKEATEKMKETGAYGVYFRLGNHVDYLFLQNIDQGIPKSISVGNNLYAWQFSSGKGDWAYPHSLNMTLYRKEDIRLPLQSMKYHNPNILETLWSHLADLSKVGLYYEHSKVLNVPLNIVMENPWKSRLSSKPIEVKELLDRFQRGFKIDITPFHHMKNRSVHIDTEVNYVKRGP